jgi:3'(2'), 5'-bisphosphate nucleotidase
VALDVVGNVADFMRRVEPDVVEALLTKDDASPVSAADFAVQAFVASRLVCEYGDVSLVAEEDSARLREDSALARKVAAVAQRLMPGVDVDRLCDWIDRGSGTPASRFWVLDPIDGTKGLIHGRQYATALSLIEHGRVEVGVIGCPRLTLNRGEVGGIAVAVRRRGA